MNEARSKLNFSEFDRPQEDAHEAAEEVRDGEMPLWDYALMHPESRLSDSEKQLLIQGLKATLGGKDRNEDGDEDEREDDDD